jgi:prophage regulatory protein
MHPHPTNDAPTTTPAAAVPERLLRLPAVLAMTGLGRSCWLDRVRRGEAPKPVKIGRATAWLESELRDWVRARVIEARAGSR